jgi:putative endonuclease
MKSYFEIKIVMANHNELGKEGEQLAEKYLQENAFSILYRNWRYSHYEIDIIAVKKNIPHFIEVKCRSSQSFGKPELSVGKEKIRYLIRAAEEFMHRHPIYKDFRIDILSISTHKNAKTEYFLIEDVYL